jgi:hypothetical protein
MKPPVADIADIVVPHSVDRADRRRGLARAIREGPAVRVEGWAGPGPHQGRSGAVRSGVARPSVTTMSAVTVGSVFDTTVTPKIASSRAMLTGNDDAAPL